MTARAPWRELLAAPLDGNHIVQIYRDEGFLAEAVGHYIGTGLARGEGIVVIATPEHWRACARQIEPEVLREAEWRGQILVLGAETTLARFMTDGMPDWKLFQDVVGAAINQVRRKYAKVRAFGEMVDLLWQRGECAAALRLEELWNHLVKAQNLSLCCAYRMDHLEDEAYNGALASVCRAHSHLIPARDYRRLEEAVNRAIREVLGPGLAQMLQSLAAARRPATHMPPAQSLLLWLKENLPSTAGKVLAHVRAHYHGGLPETS